MTETELREMVNPLFVPCPVCEAVRGLRCRNYAYRPLSTPHEERVVEALQQLKEIFGIETKEPEQATGF